MSSEIISLISVLIAVAAVLLALWQNFLTRRAVQAQVFLTVEQQAKEECYADGIAMISSLNTYDNFDTFASSETKETQTLIYETANFLNFVAHLVEKGFLPRQTAWDVYFWGYRICNDKLLPWWLEGQRRKHPRRLATFERMCKRVGRISDQAIEEFDQRRDKNLGA